MNTIRRGGPLLLVVLALLLTFTGSATATRLVTGKQIKNGSATGADIRTSSLRGADVRDGSLDVQDLYRERARQLVPPDGDIGPEGPKGPPGDRGVSGLRSISYQRSQAFNLAPGSKIDQFVPCPPDRLALSGGSSFYGNDLGPLILQSAPSSDRLSWHVKVENNTFTSVSVFLWAVCAID